MTTKQGFIEPRLQDLIPVAVAIAAGCEPCAEAAVARALKQGSSTSHIEETLRIIAYMQSLECLNCPYDQPDGSVNSSNISAEYASCHFTPLSGPSRSSRLCGGF